MQNRTYEYAIKIIIGEFKDINEVPIRFRKDVQKLVEENSNDIVEYAKEVKWNAIKNLRDSIESSGCPFNGSILDSDERSVIKLNSAVQSAQVYGENFSIDWTMQDNSVMTLSYADMLAVPLALASWSNYLHQYARELKEQINSATTVQEVMAVEWGEIDYNYNSALQIL